MRMRALALLLGLVAVAVAVRGSAADSDKLEGAWTAVSAERDGKPAADIVGHRLVFTGRRFTITDKGTILYQGIYTTEPAAKPAQIDFQPTEDARRGKTWKGIYAIAGDTLKTCDNAPDMARPRPSQFAAPAGSGYVSIAFKRDRK